MTSLMIALIVIISASVLNQMGDAKLLSKFGDGSEQEDGKGGRHGSGGNVENVDWNKRHFHDKEDYYGFLTGGKKRNDADYLHFLVGDKKAMEKKDEEGYWDFLGTDNIKRSKIRQKRSSGAAQEPTSRNNKAMDKKFDDPHNIEGWEDFILGRRGRGAGDRSNISFEDFVTGDKRGDHMPEYDYTEFVLGKRS